MLDITPAQQALILDLLQLRLPHVSARAFGSRVVGWPFGRGPKPYSDLDIALWGLRAEDAIALAHLRADLEESALPWRIDLNDACDLPSPLLELAERHGTQLQDNPSWHLNLPHLSPEGGASTIAPLILTLPRAQAPSLPASGCWPVTDLGFMQPPLWRVRAEVEHDESLLQPIAYLLLLNAAGEAWCYQRAGGDARIDGCWSCGVGGHVDAADSSEAAQNAKLSTLRQPFNPEATLRRALLRELVEELHASADDLQDLRLRGLIYEGISPIGRVHLGVLYTAQWGQALPPQPRTGEALRAQGFLPLSAIATDPRFELWSQLAAQQLI